VTVELCQELLFSLKREDAHPPPAGQRAWDWFWELDKGRQMGMEMNAISWSDIAAWQLVTGAQPELWELNAIYRMGIYRKKLYKSPIFRTLTKLAHTIFRAEKKTPISLP
jgi:hypothetical protein